MSVKFTESDVEAAFITWLGGQGYPYAAGKDLIKERGSPRKTLLLPRIEHALQRLNPDLPQAALDEALRQITRLESPDLLSDNMAFHKMLTRGIPLDVRHEDGSIRGETIWLVDFDDPDNNDWLAVNQLTIIGPTQKNRRPDVILYLNGFPVVAIELKDFTNPAAKVKRAWQQLQTYKNDIPQLFVTNAILVASDGVITRMGSLTAGWERFGHWREIDGRTPPPKGMTSLEVLARGLLNRQRLLDYIRHFILFETDDGITKKIAGYHQYYAVNAAVEQTVAALRPQGNGKAGVVWHTQGSGKSISMVFYAARLITHARTKNPTLVLITDRNDLDGQLFNQFSRSAQLLNSTPVQASSRDDLRQCLQVASGGVVFTTMQKFTRKRARKDGDGKVIESGEHHYPCLSERDNIILIADEAHRTQYNFARGLADNLQRALPNATRIGFTGTPIEFEDRNTPELFGGYIDTYTLSQAVRDQATVPIFYEARLAKLDLPESEKPRVDEDFEELTEDEDDTTQARLQRKWSELEALISTPKRLKLLARDITDHWRRRTEILRGKAMIVTVSRRVAAKLYSQIVRLNPHWHDSDIDKGVIKVVMTASSDDEPLLQPHNYTKSQHERIAKRLKDPDDPLQMVIVCDMWLTGFDAPPAHTMYIDKPIKGHNLMQAIARVNRVHKDKEGGLIVDYLGVAAELKEAIQWYDRGETKTDQPGLPVDEALALLEKHHEIVKSMFHGFDYSAFFSDDTPARVKALVSGGDHILALEDGKKRFRENMAALNKAAGLALHLEEARVFRDDIAYFQAVQKSLSKHGGSTLDSSEALNAAIRQIVSRAIVPEDKVLDLLGLAGLDKPDISILSEAFLEGVKVSDYPNLQLEAFNKLLNDEIRTTSQRNIVQGKRFSERLQEAVNRYQSRSLTAAEVIIELVALARAIREAREQGEKLGLDDNELAFYDALADHGDVRTLMGDEILTEIARELVRTIRRSVSLDWTQKESVRAALRLKVKVLLARYKYPPDKSQEALDLVLQQAEVSCADWGVRGHDVPDVARTLPVAEADDAETSAAESDAETPSVLAPLTGLWAEALECTDPALHPFILAAHEAGLNAPEFDLDWMGDDGRTDGSILPLAWPERRVAVLLREGVSEQTRGEMLGREWAIFSVDDAPEVVVGGML